MILIAHRGNTTCQNTALENTPDYINAALADGFNVEIDVWAIDGKFFLGHDKPGAEVSSGFLGSPKLWCHCKNIDALYLLLAEANKNCFFHDHDDAVLTASGYIWTYPGKPLTPRSICVMPPLLSEVGECAGVCSDSVAAFRGVA